MSRTRSAVERMARQPVPTDDQVRRAVLSSGPDRLLHGIVNDARLRAVPERGPGPRRWGPVAVVGVAVTAVLVAVAVFVLPGAGGDRPLDGVADAPTVTATTPAGVLEGLAARAATQPPVPAGRYDYLHLRYILPGSQVQPDGSTGPGGPEVVLDVERWASVDGSGRTRRSVDGGPEADADSAEAVPVDLPTDPAALERALGAEPRVTLDGPSPLFAAVEVWTHQVVDPPQQAALLRFLASRDDVRVLGGTTDLLGRPGIGVAASERSEVHGDHGAPEEDLEVVREYRFVLDAGTGEVLAIETVLRKGPVAMREEDEVLPVSRGWALRVRTGRVDSVDERP